MSKYPPLSQQLPASSPVSADTSPSHPTTTTQEPLRNVVFEDSIHFKPAGLASDFAINTAKHTPWHGKQA
jgi:hypothetical protein